ncbi:RNA-binding domain-containing protein [Athelia psychrophila]|uniref:RNA-binding domain-containing protein n=1 Tax=Athelia psychrophila TaxID=1759441 RepID=A0A167VK20_9AGAM|nr:RNA-binding domain-containing protein [Fibularhizoctonia sp. CBS 109695]
MSRLIIKNLPAYITPARLQEHFEGRAPTSSKNAGPGGTLTDVKVALKPDGTSRRFGFVGYKTEREAEAARAWFNRSFLDTTRISVDVVQGTRDAPAPRPNKRPRTGPAPSDPEPTKPAKEQDVKPKSKKAAQLDEFLEVMQPRNKKGPSWANEASSQPAPAIEPISNAAPPSTANGDINSMEVDVAENIGNEEKGEEMSDLDWMKRRMSQATDVAPVTEKAFEQSDDEDEGAKDVSKAEQQPHNVNDAPQAPEDPTIATILQTARLFMRNLAFACTDGEIRELCEPFGEISQVHIPLDPQTKTPKGTAYVTFTQPQCAVAAYRVLDRQSFQGRLLHILAAVDRKGKVQIEDGEGRQKTVKEEKAGKRKAMAGKEFNWGMLYMNSDAVASSIADRMNISKSDILNPDSSDNAAVKLALAETHVIQETKTYLEKNGIDLSAFSSTTGRIPRSDTSILVKNIPYGTTPEQIRELFEPHGDLLRVLVPPAGTMGVVEFARADEASKAFRAVAYRRMGSAVVYLEKGPIGMFTGGVAATDDDVASDDGTKPVPAVAVEDGEAELSAGTTLFVKNLSFATTTDRLLQLFRGLPSFSFARVQTKPDLKRPGQTLSMGYGFVGFKETEGAKRALGTMDGMLVDGHKLSVKFAGRGTEEVDKGKDTKGSKSTTTKMIVKNVPFEATKKDIRELFGAHGKLKSVRVPKKFDTRSRGFAFLEFLTRHEAENAYTALKHTHLLGRHLVLEWAEEAEQDLDVLRQKAGVGLGDGGEMPGKKRKLQIGGDKEDADPEDLS